MPKHSVDAFLCSSESWSHSFLASCHSEGSKSKSFTAGAARRGDSARNLQSMSQVSRNIATLASGFRVWGFGFGRV